MKQLVLFMIILSLGWKATGQGCSDAGFCSLGALKEVNVLEDGERRVDIGVNAGLGEANTYTISPYMQYHTMVNKRISLLGKITAMYANGFLGSVFHAGDFYGVATYALAAGRENDLRLLAGIKIPFTSSNSKASGGGALPLDYQSSLGTYDAIAGFNYVFRKHWELNGGIQVPVIQHNNNSFFPDNYVDLRARQFAPTNRFRRKPDLLIRAGYYFVLGDTWIIKPNLLGIYHLGTDTYEDRAGQRNPIAGSRGFTLNGALSVVKQFPNKTRLELVAATPFIVREVRADGLTRSIALNLQYSILF